MGGRSEFYVEGLSVHRVVDRLAREGIKLYSVKRVQKNGISLQVERKDSKKAFAILRSSCYNVKKVRPRGLSRAKVFFVRHAGLIAGAAVFLVCILLAQTRVLSVRVTGSGAYLKPQVERILSENGVGRFSALPSKTAAVSAAVLALPRVSFCSLSMSGGILTVNVEVSDDDAKITFAPLLAPVSGTVQELVVVRGTPLVSVGDAVEEGAPVVGDYALFGEEMRPVIVIAKVVIAYPVAREYALSEEGARAQAFLDFGEMSDLHTTKTESGWLLEGVAYATAAVNLG